VSGSGINLAIGKYEPRIAADSTPLLNFLMPETRPAAHQQCQSTEGMRVNMNITKIIISGQQQKADGHVVSVVEVLVII